MGAVNLTGQLAGWIEAEIDHLCLGEDFGYDVGWQLRQAPNGGVIMTHNVVMILKHPLLGQHPLTAAFPVPAAAMVEEVIREAVAATMTGLRKRHKAILRELRHPTAAPVTGQHPGLS